MKKGYKVIDIDTHVNPSFDTLAKFAEPSFRPRLDELNPYIRTVGNYNAISVASIPFDRFQERPLRAKMRRRWSAGVALWKAG